MMDDVHKQAQDRGYEDGFNNHSFNTKKYGYHKYSSLQEAYERGFRIGKASKEIKECENCGKIGETAIVQVDQSHLYPNYARNPVVYLYLCKECEDKA